MKRLFELKAKYDISQGKRKEDIINNASQLKELWHQYKAEYIVILSTISVFIILLVSFLVWVF